MHEGNAHTAAVWAALAALAVSAGCSPHEVEAAAPTASAKPAEPAEPTVAPRLVAPRTQAFDDGPQGPPLPRADALVDLDALLAWLRADDAPPLVLDEASVQRLLDAPLQVADAPQARLFELDGPAASIGARVVVVRDEREATGFWVCRLTPMGELWRLAERLRVDAPCLGLPEVDALDLDARRFLRLEWPRASGAETRELALALVEPLSDGLHLVLEAGRDGTDTGGPGALSVSYRMTDLELAREGDALELRLAFDYSAGADATSLGKGLWAAGDVVVRLRQERPGAPFVVVEPGGVGAIDLALFDALAATAWLEEQRDRTLELAGSGTTEQKRTLLELVDEVLRAGGSPQARALLSALPPRDELEAAAPRGG